MVRGTLRSQRARVWPSSALCQLREPGSNKLSEPAVNVEKLEFPAHRDSAPKALGTVPSRGQAHSDYKVMISPAQTLLQVTGLSFHCKLLLVFTESVCT